MPAEDCPRFQLRGPAGIVQDGKVEPWFVRWLDSTEDLRLGYKWTVAGAAEFVSGQGTPVAEVKVFAGRSNNTVSIEITGLPAGCPSTAAETFAIDPPPVAEKLAEFTGALTRIPKSHLEWMLKAMRNNPGSQIFVVVSGGASNPTRSLRSKRSVLERDLFSEFEVTPSVTIVEHLGRSDDKVVIWLVPPGAAPPNH